MPIDIFIDTTPRRRSWKQAAKVCAKCPVTEPCLEAAINELDAWSYRGGKSPIERAHYHMTDDSPADKASPKTPEQQRKETRRKGRQVTRLQSGSQPLVGRTCTACGSKFDARVGSQARCSGCREQAAKDKETRMLRRNKKRPQINLEDYYKRGTPFDPYNMPEGIDLDRLMVERFGVTEAELELAQESAFVDVEGEQSEEMLPIEEMLAEWLEEEETMLAEEAGRSFDEQ